jgi:hypothetical protein
MQKAELEESSAFFEKDALLFGGDGLDGNEAPASATIDELHAAGNLGEERVVGTTPDVQAGLQSRAALADDDGTPGHNLTGENLDAQSLGIGVAAVLRAA